MPDILHEVTIEGSPDKIYQALTEKAGLAAWWTTRTIAAKPEVGSVSEFHFSHPAEFVIKMGISQLEPGKKVYWNAVQGAPDWQGTRVTWDLESVDNGTKVLLGHRDYASYGGSFASVSYNWAWFLTSLKQYIETGVGTPAQ
jgi:uncharacterized protein YndB with AHSA1/START domain